MRALIVALLLCHCCVILAADFTLPPGDPNKTFDPPRQDANGNVVVGFTAVLKEKFPYCDGYYLSKTMYQFYKIVAPDCSGRVYQSITYLPYEIHFMFDLNNKPCPPPAFLTNPPPPPLVLGPPFTPYQMNNVIAAATQTFGPQGLKDLYRAVLLGPNQPAFVTDEVVFGIDYCDPKNRPTVEPSSDTNTTTAPPDGANSCNQSVVDNVRLVHIHDATDYSYGAKESGCLSCGGRLSTVGGLPALTLKRYHRYRDIDQHSSFGPGVYSNFDTLLNLYPGVVEFWNPGLPYALKLVPHDPMQGVYFDDEHSSIKDARLYDAAGNPTADQSLAANAVLSTLDGDTFVFEIFPVESVPTVNYAGRMVQHRDRNGNALTVTYIDRDTHATDAQLGNDRGRLWRMQSVTDAYGITANFSYVKANTIWVVQSIALPNNTTVKYSYGAGITGLSKVEYPDGTVSNFSMQTTAAGSALVSIDDAGAEGIHRRKTVELSGVYQSFGGLQAPVGSNRVRSVKNGAGEVSYYNWVALANGTFSTFAYEGGGINGSGTLLRYDNADGFPRAAWRAKLWAPNQIPDPANMELVMKYATDNLGRITSETDPLNRVTNYQLDPLSGAVLQSTRLNADGTQYAQDSTTYNSFRQPLLYTDRLGRQTQFQYDGHGNLLNVTFALGAPESSTRSWTYNAKGQPLTYADGNANVTNYHYDDPRGFLTGIEEPADRTGDPHAQTVFAYDSVGRLSTATDAVGRRTIYGYDLRNRLSSVTYNDGSSDGFTYGAGTDSNLLVSYKDRNKNLTVMQYDLAGRRTLRAVMSPAGTQEAVQTLKYLDGTTLASEVNDKGKVTSIAFDYRLRPAATTLRPNTTTQLVSKVRYDSAGRMDTRTDPYGRSTYFAYDVEDRAVRMVRETLPAALSGAASARIVSRDYSRNAAYLISESAYDPESQLLSRTDGRGIVSTMEHDAQGRVKANTRAAAKLDPLTGNSVAIADPKIAARTEFSYDGQSNLTSVRLPRSFDPAEGGNFITQYGYTGRNLLASRTEAFGRAEAATESYSYYPDRRIKDTIDARGNTWTTLWKQCCGRLLAKVDPALPDGTRPITVFNQNDSGDLTHFARVKNIFPLPTCCVTDPVDADTLNETTIKYDERHRPVAMTRWLAPLGNVDPNNPPIAGDNGIPPANGLTTRFAYDDDLTDGLGLDATYAAQLTGLNLGPQAVGYAEAVTNPAGETSAVIYDSIGRTIRSIDGNGNAKTFTYDALQYDPIVGGQQLLETTFSDALNHRSRVRADGAGRILVSYDALSYQNNFGYDANGNLIYKRDPNAVGYDCGFDERNRRISCTDTQGATTGTRYDADSDIIQQIDGFNHATICTYDGRDRNISCTDRINAITRYTFDPNNNLLTVTDADAIAQNTLKNTSYVYDPRNLLTSETFPDGKIRSYSYDAANRLASRLDQAGVTTSYQYDFVSRLIQRQYPDSLNDIYAFDAASRLVSAQSLRYGNTVTRTFDAGSRLTSESLSINGQQFNVGYAYDAGNRQTTMTYPDASVLTRGFTDRNEVQQLTYNGLSAATIYHDRNGRVYQSAAGNGLFTSFQFYNDNLISEIDGPSYLKYTYTFDANKRKTADNDAIYPQNSQALGYDNEDRLTSFTRNNGDAQNWNLSLVGDWQNFTANGVAQLRVHDAVHELTQLNATVLSYDAKGNLLTNANGQTYTWDNENRLTKAVNGATTASYSYDALGRRVSKTVNGAPTIFVSDGLQEIAEYENGAVPTAPARSYVFGEYIDQPLMMASGTQRYYYHTNNQYSVTSLTDQNRNIVEFYRYDPYGKATAIAPDGVTIRPQSAVNNPYLWQGGRLDLETGLNYKRARMYDTGLGRFVSRDPIGYLGGINLYSYAGGDPIKFVDSLGLDPAIFMPNASPEINEAVRKSIGKPLTPTDWFAMKVAGAIAVSTLTGGAAGPYMATTLGWGTTATAIGTGAVGGFSADVAVQGAELATGERKSYSPTQTVVSTGIGAGSGLVVRGVQLGWGRFMKWYVSPTCPSPNASPAPTVPTPDATPSAPTVPVADEPAPTLPKPPESSNPFEGMEPRGNVYSGTPLDEGIEGIAVETRIPLKDAQPGMYKYVVDEQGNMWVNGQNISKHSELLPIGGKAYSAGTAVVHPDGTVSVDMSSGHYFMVDPVTHAETSIWKKGMEAVIKAGGKTPGTLIPGIGDLPPVSAPAGAK